MAMLILLVLLIFFAALGVPLAFAIGASCVSYILIYAPNFIAMLPQRVWNGAPAASPSASSTSAWSCCARCAAVWAK